MDYKLNHEKLQEELNRIHDKWKDRRIVEQRKTGHTVTTTLIFQFFEDFANDLIIAHERLEVVDESGA